MAFIVTLTRQQVGVRHAQVTCGMCGRVIEIGEKIGVPARRRYLNNRYWPKCSECCATLRIC